MRKPWKVNLAWTWVWSVLLGLLYATDTLNVSFKEALLLGIIPVALGCSATHLIDSLSEEDNKK